MKLRIFAALVITLITTVAFGQTYEYESVDNDPSGARIYTLDNGLKVYLSVNKDKPRIQTFITVKTGSKNDPAEVTGLAHYLEHMIFKGTSNFGTQNWEAEKVLLDQISSLYEQHRNETDEEKKKAIYSEIDAVSNEAAKLAIANEYDKMISGLGATGTNAFTSLERTAYINDIPATEMEKWMMLESQRFSELVLRLFHTELEAVYEEFNMGQDNDYRKAYAAMNELLFPTHPYGTQTTIGEGEHLKNPSMVKIHEYFNKYYVPNNMSIAMAGDFDFDVTIAMIDKYFGSMEAQEVNPRVMPIEAPLSGIQTREVFGPMQEWVDIGYRIGGYHTEDALIAYLVTSILSNGQAGLMDLDLVQQQKVIRAGAYSSTMNDYSSVELSGSPKQGQTLEEVKDLLLAEIEKLKRGEFSEDLMKAIIKNERKDQLSQLEENWLRAYEMSDAFIMGADWEDYVTFFDRMAEITKDEVIAWAKKNLNDDYCIVYKRSGEDTAVYKVDKPAITPVELNRDAQSDFYKKFEQMESLRLTPEFVDFDEALRQEDVMAGLPFYYVKNETNDLFTLFIELDENLRKDKKVKIAKDYLKFLGTDEYSAAELTQKFYELGVQYYVRTNSVYMTGLNESFDEALALFEDLLLNCQPDEDALINLKADIKKKRSDSKKNKGTILHQGLRQFALSGELNEFNDVLTNEEVDALTADELVEIIHSMTSYEHSVFYYGEDDFDTAFEKVKRMHKYPAVLKEAKKVVYPELATDENIVYFVDYDMIQTQLLMLSKGEMWNPELLPTASMFNAYFGSGLSSIVFQEIRESKALAYSAYSYMSAPYKKDKSHYVQAFVGTQVNKLGQAVDAMLELMNNMPMADIQFNESKIAALKKIESERVIKTGIYWKYKSLERAGLDYDIRKNIYEEIGDMTINDLEAFFNEHIKGRTYAFCIIGKKADMDMETLKKLGTVKEITLEQLFGF
ncbi:MAG: insulinase family protein [Crocinitomicaceae bacterium]|nr:insulinase family protein [Crocinitomicaceae bacterium]